MTNTLGDYAQQLADKKKAADAAAQKASQAAQAAAQSQRARENIRFGTFVLAPLRDAKNEIGSVTHFDYKDASTATRILAEFNVGHPQDARRVSGQIELKGARYVFMTGGSGKQDVGNGVADDNSIATELDAWLRDMLDRHFRQGKYVDT